jgi:glycosyltransferase involved in cell wall biosynthesis
MGFTRDRVAGIVVYQSEFVASVWRSAYGWEPGRGRVIWNGTPWTEELADERLSSAGGMWRCRVVVVEGTIQADAATRSIIEGLSRWTQCDPLEREVEVIGRADKRLAGWVENLAGIRYRGPVGREDVKEALLRGDVFVPLEVNPPCPNSVVEALALGTPVVGFDTGALGELVDAGGGGGVTAPYGANPWALEEPWIPALLEALDNALSRKEVLRTRALAASRQWLSMDRMVSAYEEAMTQLVGT